MDKSISLIESLGRRSLSVVLVSILLLTTVLLEVPLSQGAEVDEDEMMQHLVQQMVQVGINQYELGYYIRAEKTLLMAQAYKEHLSALDRDKLSSLLEQTHVAALERSRALGRMDAADKSAEQGDFAAAKANLEAVKDSEYLTKQELDQVAAHLREIESLAVKEVPVEQPEEIKPLPKETKPSAEEVAKEPEKIADQLDAIRRRIAQIYYRSMQLYRGGQLVEAREGFVEVVNSGLIPAPMEKTILGYLSYIDIVLAQKNLVTVPSRVTDVIPERKLPEPTIRWPVEREVIRPGFIRPGVSEAEIIAPVAREGGYIEVINRRRNSVRSYTKAVINDAVAKADTYMNQGEFDKAKAAVETAEHTVSQNQLDLGNELFRLYSGGLKQLQEQIAAAEQAKDQELEQQKQKEAIEAQERFREQWDVERQKRIETLMESARAYTKRQRYDAALGQLETLLAIDPLHDDALSLKDILEDTIYFRQQVEMRKEADRELANTLLETDESTIPYSGELRYPKNWQEIIEKPTRQPDKAVGLDPADAAVYEQLDEVVDLSQLSPSMPFSEAIEEVKTSVEPQLKMVVLWRDLLDNATIEPITEINMDGVPAVRLGTALETLLKAVSTGLTDLGYVVANGVITVATVDTLPSMMETRVYDITDLVSEPANFRQMGMGMGMMGGMMGGMGGMMGGMGGMMGGMGGMGGMMGGMGGMGGYGGGMGGYGGGMGGYGGGMGGYGGGMGGYGGGMGGYGGGMGGYGGGMGGYGGGMGGYGGGMGGYGGGMGGYGGGMGGYGGGMGGYGMGGQFSAMQARDLTFLMQNTIGQDEDWAPDDWSGYDWGTGFGTITPYPQNQPKKLSVRQTTALHAEIEELLAELRKKLGHQVSLECRFLVVGENFLEDVGLDVDFSYNLGGRWGQITVEQGSALSSQPEPTQVPGSLSGLGPAATLTGGYGSILDDLQVSFLLRMTHAHRDAKSLTAPKVTVLSGESATFSVQRILPLALPPIQQGGAVTVGAGGAGTGATSVGGGLVPREMYIPTGSSLSITPTITQDKKNVLLNIITIQNEFLGLRTTEIETPIVGQAGQAGGVQQYRIQLPETETSQVMTRVSVPDCGTLLLGGQKITVEIEKEAGVPILNKIPIISRLFSNRSKVKDHKILLILVRPIIILQEEREAEAIAAMENAL